MCVCVCVCVWVCECVCVCVCECVCDQKGILLPSTSTYSLPPSLPPLPPFPPLSPSLHGTLVMGTTRHSTLRLQPGAQPLPPLPPLPPSPSPSLTHGTLVLVTTGHLILPLQPGGLWTSWITRVPFTSAPPERTLHNQINSTIFDYIICVWYKTYSICGQPSQSSRLAVYIQ